MQPDEALTKALEHLASEDWEKNVDGRISIQTSNLKSKSIGEFVLTLGEAIFALITPTNYYNDRQSQELYISHCAGLLSVLRLVTHNPETIMVEYKATTQLLLKQVITI